MPGRWIVHYPLIGLAIGALMLGADDAGRAVGGIAAGSLAVLGAGIAVSGGRPLTALARLGVALAGERSVSPLERLRTRPAGVVFVAAAAFAMAELLCLLHLDRFRLVGLLFVPMLARCAMVVLAVGSRAARADGRRVKLAPDVRFEDFAVASALTFAAVFLVTEFLGLLLVLASAALAIGLRVFFHWWLGGIERTTLHAGCEAVQLLGLAVLATF